jgi:glycosyltransferase involved in cell wall biosynthesis
VSQLRRLRRRTECKTLLFETPWKNPAHGWPQSSRAYARALDLVGVRVHLDDWNDRGPVCEEICRLVPERMRVPDKTWSEWDAHLFSCPLGSRVAHLDYGTFEQFHANNRPPRLFYTMFERRNLEPDLVAELNRLDGILVPCTANLRVLQDAGCRCANYVPYPYFEDDPLLALPPPRREPKTFLWIGRWEPRKAPHNLIAAFVQAFKPGEAKLLLKLGPSPWRRSEYPGPEQLIGDRSSDVEIVRETLSVEAMRGLHARADVYVSASRGEGIELGMYASKLAGRRAVTIDCGGPLDFLGEHDVVVPSTGDVLAPEYEWLWGVGAKYADYELDTLVAAMQSVMTPWTPPAAEARLPPRNRGESVGHWLQGWIEAALAGTRGS